MKQRVVDYDSIAESFDRRYEYADYSGVEIALREFIGQNDLIRLAEVGCGTGHWLRNLTSRNSAFGLDPSREMIRHAKLAAPNTSLVRGRAEQLPWATGCFDRLYCLNALHHFSGKAAFLREAFRVLRRGAGFMTIGLDPHIRADRWWMYDYFDGTFNADLRRYVPCEQIRALMAEVGFIRCETREIHHVPATLSATVALEKGLVDKNQLSHLAALSDEEYEAGLEKLRRDITVAATRGEVHTIHADLRVYATIGWVA